MKENLLKLIKDSGIVGAGGAGFPSHVKLNAKVEYVIVNGAECEPLLRVDQQLMAYKTEKILSALEVIIKETGAKKGIIAVKSKYKKALESLKKVIKNYSYVKLFTLDDFYPAGDEQVTVYEILKRIVPEAGIPLNVGVIVINVETLLNIHNALNGKPVVDKYLTVIGEVKKPLTLKVPVGVSIKDVLRLAGGTTVDDIGIIEGGPMMGKVVHDINTPITKLTKGIIVLHKNHPLLISKGKSIESILKEARMACCHCSLCTDICPRNLLGHRLHPDKLMRLASYNTIGDKKTSATEAFLCSQCGLCEQVCIMGLQPWKINKFLKSLLSSNGIKRSNNVKPVEANVYREYRKFPIKRLVTKLGIKKYNVDAPLVDEVQKEFSSVTLMLKQHIGNSAIPKVKVGDKVNRGQVIADIKENTLGSKIHSSIDGIIQEVNNIYIKIKNINFTS